MIHVKSLSKLSALLVLPFFSGQALSSLDLLAGVEAGIETATAMTNPDLDLTQRILSTQKPQTTHTWFNHETGVSYQIRIKNSYSYGDYPCIAYDLEVSQADYSELKSLDACQHRSGKWISISPNSMPF